MGYFIGGQHTFDQYTTLSGHHKCDSVRKYGLTAVESSQTYAVMDHEDPLPQVRSHRESEGVEKKETGRQQDGAKASTDGEGVVLAQSTKSLPDLPSQIHVGLCQQYHCDRTG